MGSPFNPVASKIALTAVTIVAIAGVILFFPINFSNEHTCLGDNIVHAVATASNKDARHSHPSELLRHYLIPYGILWWLSIMAAVAVAVAWSHSRANREDYRLNQR